MATSNKNEKQVMDISKPGKSAPSATAKPVIVGHGPMVQDPMVTSEGDTETEAPVAEEQVTPQSPVVTKKVITPLSEQKAPEPQPDEEPAEKDTQEPEQSEESAVVDAVIDQVGDKNQATETSEEDKKKQEHIEKLVAEKKYFVPLGKVNGKSSHNVLIITVILFLIFLGLLAAIDAEILDPGFVLPFDLIKN